MDDAGTSLVTHDPLTSVARAIAELRRGAPVVLTDGKARVAMLAAEAAAPVVPNWLTGHACAVVVTGRRAAVLGLAEPSDSAVVLTVDGSLSGERVLKLIDPAHADQDIPPPGVQADPLENPLSKAAIALCKGARLLPAAILVPAADPDFMDGFPKDTVQIHADDILDFQRSQAFQLTRVSEAAVPLADAEATRIIAFRPRDGGIEHLAIVVGEPDLDVPVLTRLHSECFTGDLLGSLKCDCGDQLRGALKMMAEAGGGVLLYLAQEGRGIGLVNKLRAYTLQATGFDTVDANEQLGFDDDERVYLPAAEMLRQLGISRVKLLTNNPAKVGALARQGVEISERVTHVFPSNEHNWQYLRTKADRSGHLM